VARALDPFYQQIQVEASSAPLRTRLSLPHGSTLDHGPHAATTTFVLSSKEAMGGDFSSVYSGIFNAAEEFLKTVMPAVFDYLTQVTGATGNVVAGGGTGPTWDLYLDALDTMDISFDENGKHSLQLVVNPETAAKLEALGGPTPDQQARLDAILTRKKAEADARRRHRTLS
jgi:hypothetical protein